MGLYELFTSPHPTFLGLQTEFERARYVILGVPFDGTSTYRSGARFAPLAIREASLNIETYSLRAELDGEDLKLHDLGDLHVSGRVEETLNRLEGAVRDLLNAGKVPILLGGEHTITLGAMRAMKGDVALISFDAHLDLRGEYLGRRISHTTFMRRLHEQLKPGLIVEVGTRAVCKEELRYARENDIKILTSQQIMEQGAKNTVEAIREFTSDFSRIYLSVDMDVLDPAFAPAVQNPEPDGLSIHLLLDLLCGVCDRRVVGFDLVEVTPHYDRGVTAIQASKIILEALCHLERGMSAP